MTLKPLLSAEEIQAAIAEMARQISADYHGRPLTVLGVLNGSLLLLADLIRQLDMPIRLGMVHASSYRGDATTSGKLILQMGPLPPLAGRHVLVVDDIFDTGRTMEGLIAELRAYDPVDVKSAVLLWKADRQQVNFDPDYHAFRIPDVFVVGYGLDYDGEYRNLPYVAELHPEGQDGPLR